MFSSGGVKATPPAVIKPGTPAESPASPEAEDPDQDKATLAAAAEAEEAGNSDRIVHTGEIAQGSVSRPIERDAARFASSPPVPPASQAANAGAQSAGSSLSPRKYLGMKTADRKNLNTSEITRLRAALSAQAQLSVPGNVALKRFLNGRPILKITDASPIATPMWGEIDPVRINKGIGAYLGIEGMLSLMRDLYLLGILNLSIYANIVSIAKEMGVTTKLLIKLQQWQASSASWTIGWATFKFAQDPSFYTDYHGEDGYEKFARDFTKENMSGAWIQIMPFLTLPQQEDLAWGRQYIGTISERKEFSQILLAGIADGTLLNEAGLRKFATEHCGGNQLTANQKMRSILPPDKQEVLNWGPAHHNSVDSEGRILTDLQTGMADKSYLHLPGLALFAGRNFGGILLEAQRYVKRVLKEGDAASLMWPQANINLRSDVLIPAYRTLTAGVKDGALSKIAGQRRFAEQYCDGDYEKAYEVASGLLPEEFPGLGWKSFKGGANTHLEDRIKKALLTGIRDASAIGKDGLARFAHQYCNDDMLLAYEYASIVLDADRRGQLNWSRPPENVSAEKLSQMREVLLRGLASGEFLGLEGQEKFAGEFCPNGSKRIAKRIANYVLSPEDNRRLGWPRGSHFTSAELATYKFALTAGIQNKRYVGFEGCLRFASDSTEGNGALAYECARAALAKDQYKQLEWPVSPIDLPHDELRRLRKILTDGIADQTLVGEQGCEAFARAQTDGDLEKAFGYAQGVLDTPEMARLQWGTIKPFTIEERDKIRGLLADARRRGAYLHVEGYDAYASKYEGGNSELAYTKVRVALTPSEWRFLGWGRKKTLSIAQQKNYREILSASRYRRPAGYDAFAIEYFRGNLEAAWDAAQDSLGVEAFAALGWGERQLVRVSEREGLKNELLKEKYQGARGLAQYAKFIGKPTSKAYDIARSLAGDEEFEKLRWDMHLDAGLDYDEILKSLIAGLKSGEYVGDAGYDQFALDYFDGDSEMAHHFAKTRLTRLQFTLLRWPSAKITNVKDNERHRMLLEKGIHDGTYAGIEGQARASIDLFGGRLDKTYRAASYLLPAGELASLGNWHSSGRSPSVASWRRERNDVIARIERGELKGPDGYRAYATQVTDGNLLTAWDRMRGLLADPARFSSLGWGLQMVHCVQDEAEIKRALESGEYNNSTGQLAFMKRFGFETIWQVTAVAKSFLPDEARAGLNWFTHSINPSLLNGKVSARINGAIRSGKYNSHAGRKRFLVDFADVLGYETPESGFRALHTVSSYFLRGNRDMMLKLGWSQSDQLHPDEVAELEKDLMKKAGLN